MVVLAGVWLGLALAAPRPACAQDQPDACVIKISGVISSALAKAVERRLELTLEQGVKTVILELNTPGGDAGASIELGDYIFALRGLDVIAYVHRQAYSGGTMLALACKEIYIDETLGKMGDVAPVGPTGEIAGEKIQTVIRETMLTYARARGYPEALVEALVTKEVEVFQVQMQDEPEGTYVYLTGTQIAAMTDQEQARIVPPKKLVVPAGQLLTMDAGEAVAYGFARKAVSSPEALYDLLGLRPGSVKTLYLSASERLLALLDVFTPLLIVAGLVLLFIEVSHPGFGLPGILGIICFAAFFIIKWTSLYARLLAVLLFGIGVAMLLVEVFITPGFGAIGIGGILLMFSGLVLALQDFTIPTGPAQFRAFGLNVLTVFGSFAAAGVLMVVLVRYMPALPLLNRLVLRHDLAAAHAGELGQTRTPGLAGMVGRAGVALTTLRPAGRAEFGDAELDVVAEGEFIEKGTRIEITEVRGSRVVVRARREA